MDFYWITETSLAVVDAITCESDSYRNSSVIVIDLRSTNLRIAFNFAFLFRLCVQKSTTAKNSTSFVQLGMNTCKHF